MPAFRAGDRVGRRSAAAARPPARRVRGRNWPRRDQRGGMSRTGRWGPFALPAANVRKSGPNRDGTGRAGPAACGAGSGGGFWPACGSRGPGSSWRGMSASAPMRCPCGAARPPALTHTLGARAAQSWARARRWGRHRARMAAASRRTSSDQRRLSCEAVEVWGIRVGGPVRTGAALQLGPWRRRAREEREISG